jgi:hypothetical protein
VKDGAGFSTLGLGLKFHGEGTPTSISKCGAGHGILLNLRQKPVVVVLVVVDGPS